MKKLFLTLFAFLFLAFPAFSHAADGMDLNQLTCSQLNSMPSDQGVAVMMWIDGFFCAKTSTMLIGSSRQDVQMKALENFCANNPAASVADAILAAGQAR